MEKKVDLEDDSGKKAEKEVLKESGRGYMVELSVNTGTAAVITMLLEVFLIVNISEYSGYLYETGYDTATGRLLSGEKSLILLFVMLGMIVFTAVFLFLQMKTARDIEKISDTVKQISEGNLSAQLELKSGGEFGNIAESLMRMEHVIEGLMEKERASEKSKTDLITNVAHDLRTPLTSIIGYIDILRKGNISASDRKKYLDIVSQKAERLQKLIEELFGFTKLSYGRLNMNVEQVDIVRLLTQLVEESYPEFEKNDLSYEFTSDSDSVMIEADSGLMVRLFDNLISNAIKYGKEGKRVNVSLSTLPEEVIVRVINFGYIIPEEELPLIFDKFYRTDHSRTNINGPAGTGLGLAIVKNITEMHQGTITVSSDIQGTVFAVRLRKKLENVSES